MERIITLFSAANERLGEYNEDLLRPLISRRQATVVRVRKTNETIVVLMKGIRFERREGRAISLRDLTGTKYHFRQHFATGHSCWSLKMLADDLRELFLTSVLDCIVPQRA